MNVAGGRFLFYLAALLLGAALLFGGGGTAAPLQNLLIELLAAGLLFFLALAPRQSAPSRAEKPALVLLALIIATPLLQLIPLPPGLWTQLPGRELASAIAAEAGSAEAWRPISLAPDATWVACLSLLPGVALFLATLRLGGADRDRLLLVAVGCALASALLGMLQFAAPGELALYGGSHSDLSTGLFINRNHQADLLLIAMILASALIARTEALSRSLKIWLTLAIVSALAAATVATLSRTGLILLPLALLACLLQFRSSGRASPKRAWLALLVLPLAAVMLFSDVGGRTLERFGATSDLRFQFWRDSFYAAREHLPLGSGLGSFEPVYRSVENLNQVGPLRANLAHSDYLQLLLETGYWGIFLVILGLALFAWLALRKAGPEPLPHRSAAAFSIIIILLHSLGDYPLRMLSLMALFGLLFALLVPGAAAPLKTSMNERNPFDTKRKIR